MDKKNLLVMTSTFPRWKNDTDPPFVFELAKRLTDIFNITVLAPHYPGALTQETIESIMVYRFRYFLKNFEVLAGSEGILPTLKKNKLFYLLVPFFILAEFWALLKLIKKTKPHIIHAHWLLPQGLVTALVNKITGIPFVVTIHGGDIYGMQGRFASALKSYVLKKAARVTVVSKDIQKTITEKYGSDIQTEVLPMGVDSSLFHPDKNDPRLRERFGITGTFLLYIGRLSEKKGVAFLLKALPILLKKYSDFKLIIVGTGELRRELEKEAAGLNLQEKVIFAGALPNKELPSYFASADIFIGPSIIVEGGDTEGFGLTFVEAAMSGCIVVGTNVGGISDIIQDGETGFLIPEKNSTAIAETLITILQDKQKTIDIQQKARIRMVQKFDWQPISNRYTNILHECSE